MAFKRKRSCEFQSTVPSPATSTTSTTTTWARDASMSPSPNPVPHAFGALSSADLNCRTRKRWRDNRPDASAIHEHTLRKLFAAQTPHNPTALPQRELQLQPVAPRQKTSLHAFWALPGQRPAERAYHVVEVHRSQCEDCDGLLVANDGAMDIDAAEQDAIYACRGCSRRVCDQCAVDRDARVCLACAAA